MADYRARRLAFTETSRAYGAGVVEAARDNPLATGVRWRLAPGHDRAADAGICARHAARDVGLGPGVWERGKPIPFPGHPSCRCSLVAVARQGDPRDVAAYVPPDVEALVATLTGFPATGG